MKSLTQLITCSLTPTASNTSSHFFEKPQMLSTALRLRKDCSVRNNTSSTTRLRLISVRPHRRIPCSPSKLSSCCGKSLNTSPSHPRVARRAQTRTASRTTHSWTSSAMAGSISWRRGTYLRRFRGTSARRTTSLSSISLTCSA